MQSSAIHDGMTNPLLQSSNTNSNLNISNAINTSNTINPNIRDEAIPFNLIKPEHFVPAIQAKVLEAKNILQKIKLRPSSFHNTIEGLENCCGPSEIASIFFSLYYAEADETLQSLAKDISPILATFSSDITLDSELFKKTKEVYDSLPTLNLSAEQKTLTEKTYRDFVRNGALLDDEKKSKLREIDQQLSVLGPQFSDNVLKATNAFELIIEDEKHLDGLPESAIEAAKMAAAEKGLGENKWLFSLQAPSFLPFMKFANNRSLREKLWKAFASRAYNDGFDNQENIKSIVQLKNDRAQLLGFSTHANFVLEERMAENPEKVLAFLDSLLSPSKKAAENELQEIKNFASKMGHSDVLASWDISYFSEKLKKEKFNLDEEELRPYLRLENVIKGVFDHARLLYELEFEEVKDVPTYHPDVKVFSVTDRSENKYLGLLYTDFYPRKTKKGGAWMSALREQGLSDGKNKRPHVNIVCNFTKPTQTKPSLLTLDEVETLFHEFGHALHCLLSDCNYKSLSGTNVYWDFVELPSQIMENWVKEKEGLDIFARHWQTNEKIPAELVNNIRNSSRYMSGWSSLRQLQFGYLDMAWHSQDPRKIQSVGAFENAITEKTRLLPTYEGANSSVSFSHIFSGGYSAGYYSYKWAEVLDADAFSMFLEKGIFNKEIAQRFKKEILTKGGTEHPLILFKNFLGREPNPNAMLKRDGLI